jgi:hypothetical protein
MIPYEIARLLLIFSVMVGPGLSSADPASPTVEAPNRFASPKPARRSSGRGRPSCSDAVTEKDHSTAEPAFVEQFELQVDIVREGLFAASHCNGRDEQV